MNLLKVNFHDMELVLGSRCELFKGQGGRCLMEAVPGLEWLIRGLTEGSGLVEASVFFTRNGESKTLELGFGSEAVGGGLKNELLFELTQVLVRLKKEYALLDLHYQMAYFPSSFT